MKLNVTINGTEHALELDLAPHRPVGNTCRCLLDGVSFDADIAEIQPNVYSILIGAKSFEVRVTPQPCSEPQPYIVDVNGKDVDVTVRDPRRIRSGARAGPAQEGRHNIAALMPGKVVRVLVAEGDAVESGQGLVVIEAMKMQNEIKCRNAGTVQKIMVREGQPVNAGDVLLAIE